MSHTCYLFKIITLIQQFSIPLKGAVSVTAVRFVLLNFANYSPSIAMELKVS